MNTKETTYVVSVLHIGVRFFNAEGQCLAVSQVEQGGSVNTNETTYVVSVLHIGVRFFNAEGSVFSCCLT